MFTKNGNVSFGPPDKGVDPLQICPHVVEKRDSFVIVKKEEPCTGGKFFLEGSYQCKDGINFAGVLERVEIPLNATSEEDAIKEAKAKEGELDENPHWKPYKFRLVKEIPFK
jgi:hypothetical protein